MNKLVIENLEDKVYENHEPELINKWKRDHNFPEGITKLEDRIDTLSYKSYE